MLEKQFIMVWNKNLNDSEYKNNAPITKGHISVSLNKGAFFIQLNVEDIASHIN